MIDPVMGWCLICVGFCGVPSIADLSKKKCPWWAKVALCIPSALCLGWGMWIVSKGQ